MDDHVVYINKNENSHIRLSRIRASIVSEFSRYPNGNSVGRRSRKQRQSERSVCWRFLVVTSRHPADQRRVGVNLTRRAASSSASASEGICGLCE